MRVLGVDFGLSRIGLAVTDEAAGLPTPLRTIGASGALRPDAEAIGAVARDEGADRVALGYPIGDEGEDGRMARIVRALAGHLRELGLEVTLVDESLTSVEAEAALRAVGLKSSVRRRRRDAQAAVRILERYLETQAR
ncbi:MAG: Holliday junction resolvase RuvX [Fimbriimonas ginsengisoli]|uniref:Putative pre-16S rRNA nuclease n=1 Tax=Fimbriimonas ginsengisoli TaxID=1005039 RepID=A0A931LU26_FIMGI|nr:Holliday junction resolvase RuvX [Fimbriimonas ginsengisoli]